MNLSVVVPVYRSKEILPELHRRLSLVLPKTVRRYEIIYVDDGSADGSWEVLCKIAGSDRKVRIVRLSRNFGQHAATLCGLRLARGSYVVTLDDDLEHPPEAIPALLREARKGWDLVYGVFPERTHSWWRNLTSEWARGLFRRAIPNLNDVYTSFRVIRADVARNLRGFESPFPFVDGYLSWVTNHCTSVPLTHGQRGAGSSQYSFSKLFLHTVNIFVTFSDLPLRLASWLGFFIFGSGCLFAAYIVVGRWTGHITVSGYASLMVGIAIFSGAQLLLLGILGEYLGRINFAASKKPLYLVARVMERGKYRSITR